MSQSLVINEIQSSNAAIISDNFGEYSDWIELYNGTSLPINLLGYSLSDNEDNPQKWIFPSVTIEAGGFLLVFASGQDQYDGYYFHTNFSINKDGEEILLSNASEVVIDIFEPVERVTDNSYGRLTDGSLYMAFFQGATPGESNNEHPLFIDYSDEIHFSHQQGFYENSFSLNISCSKDDAKIYYTLDGSDPNEHSMFYTGPISLYNRQVDDNGISTIRTNPETASYSYTWLEPQQNIFKGTVIKARAFYQNQEITPLYTKTYFIHPQIFSKYDGLPVISIITDSSNLFDYYNGIYVAGYFHDINPSWSWPWGTGNYHQDGDEWERPVNMTFFEGNGTIAFQQDVGIRIHGAGSRALPEKSLRIYARSVYGKNTINYKFFEDKDITSFKRILLRNGGQDFLTTMITDEVVQGIAKDIDVESQASRPCVVFINGEFWGIHNIRERIDKYFLEENCNANPDKITILEDYSPTPIELNGEYVEIINFVSNNDLSLSENYEWVARLIDIENYIDYEIIKQFISVYDWPGNNISFWKEDSPDSKWRWILFDSDQALINYAINSIIHSTLEGGEGWPNPDGSTVLLRNLLKNNTFKQQYLDRFEYHLLNTFSKQKMNDVLDEMVGNVENVMPEHIARWGYPYSFEIWDNNINKMRLFFENRPCYMLSHLINYFEIDDPTYGHGICDSINYSDSIIKSESINVWPNPSTDVINIEFLCQECFFAIESIEVFDILGRKVLYAPLPTSMRVKINVSELPSGTYFVNVKFESKSIKTWFIKV